MSDSRDDDDRGPTIPGRRNLLKAGALLAAAPLVGGIASRADAAEKPVANGPITARAYGSTSATGRLEPLQIKRRAVGPHDVLLDVLYCGICHSDIHQARNEWSSIPTVYPCVPGHEIIGRVQAVGSAVTRFKVGDVGGVGCMVDSCGTCDNCLADREQNCLKGAAFTYNSPDRATGENTLGGYSEKMVVSERFVIRIPPGADLAATAPLLCAGITTFSPMQHWKLSARQRVGVIGLGGLGHMAVKLAAARKAEVTVFTTSPGKIADAQRLGAKEAVLSSDTGAMKRLANRFDLLISTTPAGVPDAAVPRRPRARRNAGERRRAEPARRRRRVRADRRTQEPRGLDDRRHRGDAGGRRLLRRAGHQGGRRARSAPSRSTRPSTAS